MEQYEAGNIKHCLQNWQEITSDPYILDIVKYGLKLDFLYSPPACKPYEYGRNNDEKLVISEEIQKLLKKKVIQATIVEPEDFFSSVFTRPKKDGNKRMILNLKQLNEYVFSPHFKMDSIQTVINMIAPNVWMASVDLKDAYFSIPIHKDHQKYLKFMWKIPYKFIAMPNGYGPAMLKFTKIMKPPFSYLRKKGHQSVVFVDDTYLQSNNFEDCKENIRDTVQLLISLGFTIHAEKSVITPTQEIIFLGFVINSIYMTLTLTQEKKNKIKELCIYILKQKRVTIRNIAVLLGNFTAAIEAVPYSKLHYRSIECSKIKQLKEHRGNFDSPFELNQDNITEIVWWIDNIDQASRSLIVLPIDYTIYTDASKLGWGAKDHIQSTGGQWTSDEIIKHINVLELKAAFFGISALKDKKYKHARIMIDNTTAVAYINKMGGTVSQECNEIAKQIWYWAMSQKIWISAAHIPGTHNQEADFESRNFNIDKSTDWTLSDFIFNKIIESFGTPDIDMFSARINNKLPIYVSWKPDPYCYAVDALSMEWKGFFPYCFPPFSVIQKVMHLIQQQQVKQAIVIAPMWATQAWFPTYTNMLVSIPIVFPSTKKFMFHPSDPTKQHPLANKMKLMGALLSADASRCQAFRMKLQKLYCNLGEGPLGVNMKACYENGNYFVVKGTKIPFLSM